MSAVPLLSLAAVLHPALPSQAQKGPLGIGEAEILLTVTEGRQDYDLRLRDLGDGTFSTRTELPDLTQTRSLRLGTDGETNRGEILLPELQEARDGSFTGTREANGVTVTVTVKRGGRTTIIIVRW
ncbi:hypothetical protein [Rubrivirga sp. IMCC43871]|uniref:hypothetical protein n=1 Tax=Rubrivirga sp. IMCC43871 TaxID=3391575 RepID=UPI00398FE567